MKNVEKHINEIVSKVLSEQVALKAEEIMSMANEELHGGQKKLDKNKNGKLDSDDFKMLRKDKKEKPRTPAGFEHGEIVSGDVDEDEVDSQWMADEKLAKNEPLYRGVDEAEMEEYSFGDTATDDDLGYNDMLPSAKYEKEIKTPHKVKNVGDKYQRKVSKEFSEGENEDEGFPDLSGDGKITKKDVLLGRGVKLKESLQLTEDELSELERQEREKSVIKDSEKDLKALERLENEIEQAETILKDAKLDEDKLLENENLNDIEKKQGNIDQDSLDDIEENMGKRYMDEDLNSKDNPYGLNEFDVEEVDELLNTEKK